MMNVRVLSVLVASLGLVQPSFGIDLLDQLGITKSGTNQTTSSTLNVPLSQDQMVQGLKEALGKGVQQAISKLGQTNGFLTNANVRIPMPQKLQSIDKGLRAMKQDKIADDLIVTMNHAAEQAVPEAVGVFTDSLKQMSIQDAKSLLTGNTNAATQFFRRTTETNLYGRFLPIVKSATKSNRVVDAYKNLMTKAQEGNLGNLGGLADSSSTFGGLLKKGTDYVGNNAVDIDAYVTQKALDGLFKMMAEEEKKIRENPAARSTELLQKVFGAVKN